MSKFVHSLLKPYLDCLQLPVRPEKLNAASVTSIDLSGARRFDLDRSLGGRNRTARRAPARLGFGITAEVKLTFSQIPICYKLRPL